jgi:hypothetical protein
MSKQVKKTVKPKKITWEIIYKDFRRRHPTLKKEVTYWRPHDYATIMLYLKDGTKMLYNYDYSRAVFCHE